MWWGSRHSADARAGFSRSMRRRAPIGPLGLTLILTIAVACQGGPAPSTAPNAPPSTALGSSSPGPAAATTPRPAPTPVATEPSVAELGPVGGVWRVRKILSLEHRSALIPGAVFDEEAYALTPDCDNEPCKTVEVRMTPLGRTQPVSIVVLERDGNRYVSAARAENEGPCLDEDGDAIRGGAKVTSTMRLWLSTVRASGSAVETTEMRGSLDLALEPTAVGSAAGCVPQTAAYELSGRREAVAVRDAPLPDVEQPPNTAGGLANLPRINVKVNGAEVIYFEIEGDTVAELAASLANGGVQSCGAINYEWHEGDTRPAACAVTSFPDIEDAIDQRVSNGDCTIARSTIRGKFAVHMPRWVAPKRVPKRLLAWWREVVEFIRDHEAGHVVINLNHLERLNKRLVGEDCEDADSIIGRWAKDLSSAQEEYDRKEYAKPWPEPPAGY
jgi:predicted secreted Zn-dependent protease